MSTGLGKEDIAGHIGVNHYLKYWNLCHKRFININIMNKKRLLIQVLAAVLLYVIISLILEKEYSNEIILREILEGLVFGALYGVFIWLREKWKLRE